MAIKRVNGRFVRETTVWNQWYESNDRGFRPWIIMTNGPSKTAIGSAAKRAARVIATCA